MRTATALLLLAALAACGRRPPVRATTVEGVVPTILGPKKTFTVTTDGQGVVNARFGPRQVSKFVSEKDRQAVFASEEFPEGIGAMVISLQSSEVGGSWQGRTKQPDVYIDRTAPELVRVGEKVLGPKDKLALWVWDAVMLGSMDVIGEGGTIHEDFAPVRATSALVKRELDVATLAEGRQELQVVLVDAAGNKGSTKVPLLIDRTPPTVRITAPAAGTEVSGTLTVEVEATDAASLTSVELFAGGAGLASVAGPRASLVLDAAVFLKGPLTLSAQARDEAGNLSPLASVEVVVR